jgi:hypothetical protein
MRTYQRTASQLDDVLRGVGADSAFGAPVFENTLPSALWCERLLARCKLGVLDSAGAATCHCDLVSRASSASITWELNASRWRPAFSSHLLPSFQNRLSTEKNEFSGRLVEIR